MAVWNPLREIENMLERYNHATGRDIDNGVLSITGEKLVKKETGKGSKHHRMERYSGSFARRFTLPNTIKAGKVDATYRNGVLSLMIPKTEESRPKAIEIKVH